MTVRTQARARTFTAVLAAVLAVGLAGGLVGCTDSAPDEGSAPPVTSPGGYDPEDQEAIDEGVSMEQAGVIATDEYPGTIVSIEDDDHEGEPAWEVEINGSSEGRIEVTVSKATGQILRVEND